MRTEDRVISISDFNLSYLMLAQRLVMDNDEEAMFRLGVSREVAKIIGTMSTAQLIGLARTNMLLCSFRLNNHKLLSAMVNGSSQHDLQQMHMAILLSSQPVESVN